MVSVLRMDYQYLFYPTCRRILDLLSEHFLLNGGFPRSFAPPMHNDCISSILNFWRTLRELGNSWRGLYLSIHVKCDKGDVFKQPSERVRL